MWKNLMLICATSTIFVGGLAGSGCRTAAHTAADDVERQILRLQDSNPKKRALAADQLQKLGDIRAIQPLTRSLKGDSDDTVRAAAALALGGLARFGQDAVSPLIESLQSKTETNRVRMFVAMALGVSGDSTAVSPLISALEDNDPAVRGAAALALGEMVKKLKAEHLQPAMAPLRGLMRDDPVLAVRTAASSALHELEEME